MHGVQCSFQLFLSVSSVDQKKLSQELDFPSLVILPSDLFGRGWGLMYLHSMYSSPSFT